MTRRIVITGAQGFLGRYLAAHWLSADPGVEIVGVGRSSRRRASFTHTVTWGNVRVAAPLPSEIDEVERDDRYRYESLDLLDGPALIGLLQEIRPDVVVHLAGELRDASPERLLSTNVGATIALFEAIAGAGIVPPRVVVGSSGAVYGRPAPGALPFREDAPCVPTDLYAMSKRAAEDAARILAQRHRVPALWARIFNPVGPGQDERHLCGRIAAQIAAIAAGALPPVVEIGALDRTRDFVDVRDVVRALAALAASGTPGEIYNVATGVETSVSSVLAAALAAADLTTSSSAGVSQGAAVRIERRPDRPDDAPRHVADVRRLQALGITPRHTVESSIADLLAYYRGPVARAAAARRGLASTRPPRSLTVTVSARHAYSIVLEPGLLRTLPSRLRSMFPGARMVVLDDSEVHALYGDALCAAMRGAGIPTGSVTVPEKEASKSLDRARDVIERLHDQRFDRRSVLVNLGGGMITDLGGYVAAIYMRGVSYVNVPTTLLAQHDSAVGGKVAVNMPWAKNFVGAFHHPRAVYCDPAVLRTLSARDLAAGVAEAIKIAILGDPDLFELLERDVARICARDVDALGEVVRRAAGRKIAALERDPYEVDLRRALNLGHTYGHPLEVELGYDGILHGEAVAFGLAVATEVAATRGVCGRSDAGRIYALLHAYQLPPRVAASRLDAARRRLDEVRLVRAGRLNFVLPERIGAARIVAEVSDDEIAAALHAIAGDPILGRSVVAG